MAKLKGTTIELTSPETGEILFAVDSTGNITSPTISNLSPVAVSGSFNDLLDKPAVYVSTLSQLEDVYNSDLAVGQFLVYTGSNWANTNVINSPNASTTPLDIYAYASQSADLIKVQTASGTPLFSVSNVGEVYSHTNFMVKDITIGTAPQAGDTSNVAIGSLAGENLLDGSENVFIGYGAGQGLSTEGADANVVVGSMAAGSATFDGYFGYNTLIGVETGVSLKSGLNNILLGWGSGSSLQRGNYNTIMGGYNASDAPLVDGDRTLNNSIVLSDGQGNCRLFINESGNVGFGTTSPTAKLDVVGDMRLASSTTNTVAKIGTFLGRSWLNSDGDWVGVQLAGLPSTNHLYIGGGSSTAKCATDIIFYTGANTTTTNGTERMRINSSGSLLFGTTSTSTSTAGLHFFHAFSPGVGANPYIRFVKTFSGTTNAVQGYHAGTYIGGMNLSDTAASFATSSDYRLKENVIGISDGLERLSTLRPVRFNFISKPDQTLDGFLAHEVADVVPNAVSGKKDDMNKDGTMNIQALDHSKLVPLLTAAIKELHSKVESLELRLAELESK